MERGIRRTRRAAGTGSRAGRPSQRSPGGLRPTGAGRRLAHPLLCLDRGRLGLLRLLVRAYEALHCWSGDLRVPRGRRSAGPLDSHSGGRFRERPCAHPVRQGPALGDWWVDSSLERECLGGVAARFTVQAALGDEVTFECLRHELERAHDDVAVVHLACHGVFNSSRPERSGLVPAAERPQPWAPNDVVTLPQLAELPWAGAVVVLARAGAGWARLASGTSSSDWPGRCSGVRAVVVSL
ncbi:CHAT domain-containing protein [Nonomuraea sp. NPDC049714]|uniref:CHAT domain-containing protein n=1 Tax=Nonomuraea sp. NPDC049714 TaxID=3364357 RepID=UPI00378869A2